MEPFLNCYIWDINRYPRYGSINSNLNKRTLADVFWHNSLEDKFQNNNVSIQIPDFLINATQEQKDFVQVNMVPSPGQWIRRRGEDLSVGKLALSAGTFLRPQQLGVAASAGYAQLKVKRKVKVAAFFTGDELSLPGEPLKPGGIYNSNRDTLLGLVRSLGCEATDYGIVPDRLEATREALRTASLEHDLIITSGGVSVG